MNDFEQLLAVLGKDGGVCAAGDGRVVLAGRLGGRVFAELGGQSLHRLDIENVRQPDLPFNNYGGNNFWPAPEGGTFGFNYKGDEWLVQRAINDEPFALTSSSGQSADVSKRVTLVNRRDVNVDVDMRRTMRVVETPGVVAQLGPAAVLSYEVDDSIELVDPISIDDALVACWTLEQFDARAGRVSFARVAGGAEAINFDFYEHPGDRISYGADGFTYRTDGGKAGQIGLKTSAGTEYIGFWDRAQKLLCLRQVVGEAPGRYFNIADNDQPDGPFSAADNYSIFNSDPDLRFFELETIGAAIIEEGKLKGSRLSSRTTFALFDDVGPIDAFLEPLGVNAE